QQGRRLLLPRAQGRSQEYHWLCRLLERRQGGGLERAMKRLAGKIAIVTGSSSGIGKAIALTFAKEGASVVVAARRKELCEKTVTQIRHGGGDATAVQTDVTDEAQVERLITETVKRYGRRDLLVNNP